VNEWSEQSRYAKAGNRLRVPEFSDWWLWIASPVYDSEGIFEALRRIQVVLRKASPRMPIELDQITVVSPKDPVIRHLRRRFGKADCFVEGTRIGGQMIGDRFVDEAFRYRVKR